MCGIAGFILKDSRRSVSRETLLDELLLAIDHRGGDATGFVALSPSGHTVWEKAACDAKDFLAERKGIPADTSIVLAHTRWATQGHQGFARNNHPIRRGDIYVIHNGIVANDSELFARAERERFGEVDSEAIAAILAHTGNLAESRPALESIRGSAAIAAVDERNGDVLLARVSSSPLYVLETRRIVIFASTYAACERAHKTAIGSLGRVKPRHLDEGDAILIRDGRVKPFRFEPPVVKSYVPVPVTSAQRIGDSWNQSAWKTTDTRDETLARTYEPSYSYAGIDRCDVCGHYTADPYTVWDGLARETLDLCEDCYTVVRPDPSYAGFAL